MMQSTELSGCELSFECPKKWEDLKTGSTPDARWCATCSRTVHLCNNKQEFETYAATADCIAFYRIPSDTSTEKLGLPAGFSDKIGKLLDKL